VLRTDDVEAVLRKAEANQRRAGWDQPATLWRLVTRAGGLACIQMPFGGEGYPADKLEYLADMMRHNPRGRMAAQAVALAGNFIGFAVICESWGKFDMTPDEQRQRTTRLADTPGAVEVRVVSSVDITGQAHFLLRKRGEKLRRPPELSVAEANLQGRIPDLLRDLVLTVALLMPDGDADLAALGALDFDLDDPT
jgi:hypothetical protein